MKDLDNLIPDIYAVLEGLNSDVGIDIPEELTEEFLVNILTAGQPLTYSQRLSACLT
jgi:hypothetical protein